jgi:SAM-dependent methyltransferase
MNYYTENADELFAAYQALPPEEVHAAWLDLLPAQAGLACDIGAGSGRDAKWLASKGWDVTAVEPCDELRSLGQAFTTPQQSSPGSVSWLDDALPDLKRLRALDQRFQLILISAVWMHLTATQHERAMRIVSELLAPGGVLVISLRHGDDPQQRFHPVTAAELILIAQSRALLPRLNTRRPDLTRPGIEWDCLAFCLPDDGSGSLPLLRHIIVNDNKFATYKLGLLRALIRIAEGAPGMVTRRDDAWVDIPFGLVALYWLKMYMPLVLKHDLIQTPTADHQSRKGYGWASSGSFYHLSTLSPYDLRVGATFEPETATSLISALKDICRNIEDMPATFITYPGQTRQVFECNRPRMRSNQGAWQCNKQSLAEFGTFRIPAFLWQTFSQHACWLEPAIVNEWARLMRGWSYQYDASVYERALQWNEDRRDTLEVRARVKALQDGGKRLACVWSRKKLSDQFAVDHCFPWSRWFNNDLWNLMPTTEAANTAKGDKLPSALLLEQSKPLILAWWEEAFLSSSSLADRFILEAEAALPLVKNRSDVETIYAAMQHQRAKLKASQQLAEWTY